MRVSAVVTALCLSISTGAAAQQPRLAVETRVGTLEAQMRSVQRKVFLPGSVAAIQADAPAPVAATNGAIADLTQRVDALERQLAAITGQVEENGNAIRLLNARLDGIAAASVPRVAEVVPAPAPVATAEREATPAPSPAPVSEPDAPSADPAENAYLAGFRLWEAKRYDEAASTLKPIPAKYAKHRRASWARNLLGRAYLDDNKPATAAEAFLANYQELPQGERAADSLYFLGAALMKLNKPEQACKVYDELSDVYGGTMRDFLKSNLPGARKQAKCQS